MRFIIDPHFMWWGGGEGRGLPYTSLEPLVSMKTRGLKLKA